MKLKQTISCQTGDFVQKRLFQFGIFLNCLNLVEFYGGGGGGGWLIWPPSEALVRELGGVELRALALVLALMQYYGHWPSTTAALVLTTDIGVVLRALDKYHWCTGASITGTGPVLALY